MLTARVTPRYVCRIFPLEFGEGGIRLAQTEAVRNQSREDFSLMKFFSQGPLAGWSRAKSMVASKKPLSDN